MRPACLCTTAPDQVRRSWQTTLAAGGVRCLGSTCRRSVGPNPPLVTQSGRGAKKHDAVQRGVVDTRNAPYGKSAGLARHSALMPANLITFAHFSVSSAMSFSKSAEELAN